jgi:UDP-glucose 4-epimerase
MEKILVTGGSGFLGSWLVRILSQAGYSPSVLVRPESSIWRLELISECTIIRAHEMHWNEVITDVAPSTLIALDWAGVQNLERNQDWQYNNIERILRIARQAKEIGIRHYIGFGSQAELGPTKNKITETSPTNPTNSYGRAKCETRESLTDLFLGSETEFTWGRIFSTYGQLDSPGWLIPQMIASLHEGRNFEMTQGSQNWNYLHAYDFATAVIKILESKKGQNIINIASPITCLISEVGQLIERKMSRIGLVRFGALPYRTDQVMNLDPDTGKLESLGWEQQIDLNSGLNQLIDWYCDQDDRLILASGEELPLPKFRQLH